MAHTGTWYVWTSDATTATESTYTTSNVWQCWTDTSSNTTATTDPWAQWTHGTSASTTNIPATDITWYRWGEAREETEAQKAERLERERREERERKEYYRKLEAERLQRERDERAKVLKARRKAKRLLRRVLTADEWRQWVWFRQVKVMGSQGGKYIVRAIQKVSTLIYKCGEDWKPITKYCYHPDRRYCLEDQVAALILDVKCDESRVLSLGNVNAFVAGEAERIENPKARLVA